MEHHQPKRPSPLLSLIPVLTLVVLLFFTITVFGSSALGGGSQVVLLTTTAVCSGIAILVCKVRWKTIEESIANNIKGVSTALIILLLIGALSGSWMVSGVVPTLIYYGMKILHPSFFLVSCCVICAIISVMTGSSWTTIATIGVAMIGIGEAQGFPVGWIAGAIISGAYFGDKISPLSETTVLAASVTHTPLFTHIRYMLYTTVPSMLITLLIFGAAGFFLNSSVDDQMAYSAAALQDKFNITLWVLIVPVLTGVLIAKKVPSIITLFLSSVLAVVFAVIFQPHILTEISGDKMESAMGLFKGVFITLFGETNISMGSESMNDLVSTLGMSGMMDTIWLILCAMCFGGAMTASGMIQSLTSLCYRFMKKRVGMVTSTVVAGISLNICTADQYISIILTGDMFRKIYEEKGYPSYLLSRTTEDAVTVTSVLVPWNTCGLTQATVLGVATVTYLPYCFFNLLSPFMSIFMAVIGYKIRKTDEKDESVIAG